jgi:1,4-dihydroxy-2-naphthoate octaprenyltransferase
MSETSEAREGSAIAPGSLRAWLLASRPKTLSAAFVPVAVGTACAQASASLRFGPAVAALLGSFCLQIGANFANDVFDYEKGADTADRLGPTRAVQAGLLDPQAVRRGMYLVFGLALLIGIYLTWVAGPIVIAIGVCSILSAIAYTGGPYPLGYNGLGDVFVFVFFGLVAVCGTTFVQTGYVPTLSLWASVPVGALATAILVVNNIRDRKTDKIAGKRTLAVRFGRRVALTEFTLLCAMSYAVPCVLFLSRQLGPTALAPLFTMPMAVRLMIRITRTEGRSLNPVLVGTAKLLLVFGILFAAGIATGTLPGATGPIAR